MRKGFRISISIILLSSSDVVFGMKGSQSKKNRGNSNAQTIFNGNSKSPVAQKVGPPNNIFDAGESILSSMDASLTFPSLSPAVMIEFASTVGSGDVASEFLVSPPPEPGYVDETEVDIAVEGGGLHFRRGGRSGSLLSEKSSTGNLEEIPLVAPRSTGADNNDDESSSSSYEEVLPADRDCTEEWLPEEDEYFFHSESNYGGEKEEILEDEGFECIDGRYARSVPAIESANRLRRRKSIIGPIKRAVRSTAHLIEDIDRRTKPLQNEVGRRAFQGADRIGKIIHDTTLDVMDTAEQVDILRSAESVIEGFGSLFSSVAAGGYSAWATFAASPVGNRIVSGVSLSFSRAEFNVLDASIALLSEFRDSLDRAVHSLDERKVAIDGRLRPFGLPRGEVVPLEDSADEIDE